MTTPVGCHEIPLRDSLILIVSWKMNTNRSHRQITVGYLKILLLLDRIHARFPRLDTFEGRSQISKPKFNDSTLLFGHHTGPLIDHITKIQVILAPLPWTDVLWCPDWMGNICIFISDDRVGYAAC